MKKKKPTSKKSAEKKLEKITLTIRAHSQDEIKTMNKLLEVTRHKTFPGALMSAAEQYPNSLIEIEVLKSENNRLNKELSEVHSLIIHIANTHEQTMKINKVIQKHRPYETFDE